MKTIFNYDDARNCHHNDGHDNANAMKPSVDALAAFRCHAASKLRNEVLIEIVETEALDLVAELYGAIEASHQRVLVLDVELEGIAREPDGKVSRLQRVDGQVREGAFSQKVNNQ